MEEFIGNAYILLITPFDILNDSFTGFLLGYSQLKGLQIREWY